MNTDERLDRLTEKHGALAESSQLLTADVQSLAQSVKEHDRILRGHADLIGDLAPDTNSALRDWKAVNDEGKRALVPGSPSSPHSTPVGITVP